MYTRTFETLHHKSRRNLVYTQRFSFQLLFLPLYSVITLPNSLYKPYAQFKLETNRSCKTPEGIYHVGGGVFLCHIDSSKIYLFVPNKLQAKKNY